MTPKLDKLLSSEEVTGWLGISMPTLCRMRYTGTGPEFIQVSSRRIVYSKEAVEAWLETRILTRKERHVPRPICENAHP